MALISVPSKEDILDSGTIDPELAEVLAAANLPSPDWTDLNALVKGAESRLPQLIQTLGDPPDGVERFERMYTTRDKQQLRAQVLRPAERSRTGSPLVIIFHGGGFCTGAPEAEEIGARNIVQALNALCVCPSYRLAPQYPFPYAVNDAWDALKWAAESAQELGADPSKGFIIAGSSAGANLAANVAHRARDENFNPPLTGQFLAIPMVCTHERIPAKYNSQYISWEQNENAPVMPVAAVEMFMRGYQPDIDDSENFSVLNHPRGHANLPRTCIVADGMDPLRDQALVFEKSLREEYGVTTRLYLYPGMPHSHWSFFPMLQKSKEFRKDQVEAYRWLLES